MVGVSLYVGVWGDYVISIVRDLPPYWWVGDLCCIHGWGSPSMLVGGEIYAVSMVGGLPVCWLVGRFMLYPWLGVSRYVGGWGDLCYIHGWGSPSMLVGGKIYIDGCGFPYMLMGGEIYVISMVRVLPLCWWVGRFMLYPSLREVNIYSQFSTNSWIFNLKNTHSFPANEHISLYAPSAISQVLKQLS